jgi:ABC-type taurine transport system ATPase subunit
MPTTTTTTTTTKQSLEPVELRSRLKKCSILSHLNEIRLKSIFQLSSHMKSAKFMARGLVTERIFSLVHNNFQMIKVKTRFEIKF